MSIEEEVEQSGFDNTFKYYHDGTNEERARKDSRNGKVLAACCAAGAAAVPFIVNHLSSHYNTPTLDYIVLDAGFTGTFAAASIHFYELGKLAEILYKRITGQQVNESEEKIKRRGVIGRTAHRVGAALGYATGAYILCHKNPILGGVVAGLSMIVYRYNILHAYKGIYSAAVDLALGKRRAAPP